MEIIDFSEQVPSFEIDFKPSLRTNEQQKHHCSEYDRVRGLLDCEHLGGNLPED